MTFQYIGWYGAIVVITTFLKFGTSWLRNYTEKDLREQARTKTEKRMQHINESFQNIKGVKLYGWENKFINKLQDHGLVAGARGEAVMVWSAGRSLPLQAHE